MFQLFILTLLFTACNTDDLYEYSRNLTRSTLSGIAAYRSALTLDWLAGEDFRQRELAQSYETEKTVIKRGRVADCIGYARPSAGKVARLMLELLKNLEGDDGPVIAELVQVLMRSKLLVETAMMDSEPNLDSLVETPGLMMGEPHVTLPRMVALTWLVTTDPVTTKKEGWCPVRKLNHYLLMARPSDIAKQMQALDPIVARARFIIEDFIRKVTPLNMFQSDTTVTPAPETTKLTVTRTTSTHVVLHHQTEAEKEREWVPGWVTALTPPPPAPFPFPYELINENQLPKGFKARKSGRRGGEMEWGGGSYDTHSTPAPQAQTKATIVSSHLETNGHTPIDCGGKDFHKDLAQSHGDGEVGFVGGAGRAHPRRLTWLSWLLPLTALVLL